MNKEAMYKAFEVRKDILLTYLKTLLTALMLDISAVIGISYKKGNLTVHQFLNNS